MTQPKNVTLVYDAPEHHRLEVDGDVYSGGQEFKVSKERAKQILLGRVVPIRDAETEIAKLLSPEELEEAVRLRGHVPEGDKAALAAAAAAPPLDHTPPPGGQEPVDDSQEGDA